MTMIKLKSINEIKSISYQPIYDFSTPCFKGASFDYVLENTNDEIVDLLKCIPLERKHKNILVDVKVHSLKSGEYPALPHWHIDGVSNYFHPEKEEVNHLYITESGSSTEFLTNPELVDIQNENTNFDKILKHCSGTKINPNTIYTYGRVPHRATPSTQDCVRLLVRVTETNILKPKNQIFKPTYWNT